MVTWDDFGQGFTRGRCEPCHASTATARNGAPESVTFDTPQDVAAHQDRILALATGDSPIMPPAGGVTADERYELEVWLRCHPPAL